MAAPYPITISVLIDLGSSPTFPVAGTPFTLDNATYGRLDYNYLSSGTSNIVDVSSQVLKIQIGGGYNLLQDQFEPNTGYCRIYDPNGWWNPQNTASPYYGYLQVNKKIRIAGIYNGTTYNQFSGYINAYNYTFPTAMNFGYVDLQICDAFRLFNLANINTITGGTNGQTTGQRINTILDNVNFPTNLRQIDTGDYLCAADPGTQRTVLSACKNVEAVEQGAFYADADGNVVFKSRSNVVKTGGSAPITYFSNDGTAITYSGVSFAHDDKLIVNQATMTRVGGTNQTYVDSVSVSQYFPHSVNLTNLVAQTDAQCLDIARVYVQTRKDTTIRIDSLSQDLTTPDYASGIVAALTLDYFSTVNIKNVQSNGSTITKTLQIMGSNYTITPNAYDITFTTSESITDGFVLNSLTEGILDTSILN
jgi:hypothetical protein